MKAISLWQPHASAVALGSKRIETRGWATPYRGPLAIHAAGRLVNHEMVHYAYCGNWRGALKLHLGGLPMLRSILPFGAIIAVCELTDCRPVESFAAELLNLPRRPEGDTSGLHDWTERQMGNFEPRRYGWVLENVRLLAKPVPFSGRQQFFNVPDELLLGGAYA